MDELIVRGWKWLGILGSIFVTLGILFWIGSRDEDWDLCLPPWAYAALTAAAGLNSFCILLLGNTLFWTDLMLGWMAGSLTAAVLMDLWDRMIYRYVWWSAGAAAGCIWLLRVYEGRPGGMTYSVLIQLMGYILIQQIWFGKLYGRADCHAFSVCAAGMAAYGLNFADYVIHMSLAYLGLTAVQFIAGNVASGGRLKEPVPFVPYIVAAFWLWVDFAVGKWYI